MGAQYRILDEEEYADEPKGFIIHIITNLPWEMFENATKANDEDYE